MASRQQANEASDHHSISAEEIELESKRLDPDLPELIEPTRERNPTQRGCCAWIRTNMRFCVGILAIIFIIICLVSGLVLIIYINKGAFTTGDSTSQLVRKPLQKLKPTDCTDICRDNNTMLEEGPARFGRVGIIGKIYPRFARKSGINVYCDCENDPINAWTVIQRRLDGSVDFNRAQSEYQNGFGDPNGEFWLGLETIHKLTSDRDHELRVDMAIGDSKSYAQYSKFAIDSASSDYRLTVGGYSGAASDSFSYHNEASFCAGNSIKSDGTRCVCGDYHNGGWWYYDCFHANLNGEWRISGLNYEMHGIIWEGWKGWEVSLQQTEMKIRPIKKT